MNWSITSGGGSGTSIPGASDDVYFDANSFDKGARIEIDINAVVNNFNFSSIQKGIWFDDPSFSHSIEVKGSFNAQHQIDGFSIGELILSSFAPATFKASNSQFRSNIEFRGNYELQDELVVRSGEPGSFKKLLISSGSFKTNGFDVMADIIDVPSVNSTSIDFSTSTLHVSEDADFNLSQALNIENNEAKIKHAKGIESNLTGTAGFDGVGVAPKNLCANGIEVIVTITSDYNGEFISCNGACDAVVLIAVVQPVLCGGGVCVAQNLGPCTADSIIGVSGDTTFFEYAGQCVGSDTYTARDSCQEIFAGAGIYEQCAENIGITEPFTLVTSILLSIDPVCPDSCNGQGFISVGGGTGPISTLWCNGETGTTPTGLCDGCTCFTVSDINGCSVIDSVCITEPPPINLNIVSTPVTCFGDCDGEVTSSPTGGTGPVSDWIYNWDGLAEPAGDSTQTITGLCFNLAGTLDVLDTVNNCPFSGIYQVTEPPILQIDSVEQVNNPCDGSCVGSLEVIASGGVLGTGYNYQWVDNAFDPIINPGNGSAQVTLLCEGDYYCIVTDDNGCADTSQMFTITAPLPILFTTVSTDISCFGDCNGEVSWTVSGGSAPIVSELFMVTGTVSQGFVNPTLALCAEDYYVVHTDDSGCVQISDTVTIAEPPPMVGVLTGNDPQCSGGTDGVVTGVFSGGSGAFTW